MPRKSNTIQVKSVEQLKQLAGKTAEFFINFGFVRSTKQIRWNPKDKKFRIHHEIDGSHETLSEEELAKTNIVEAINKGAFFAIEPR